MHKTITEQFHHWLNCTFSRPPAGQTIDEDGDLLDCSPSARYTEAEVTGFMETEIEKGMKDG